MTTRTTSTECRARRFAALLVAVAVLTGCSVFGDDDDTKPATPVVWVLAPAGCDLAGCVGEGIDTSTGAYTTSVQDLVFPGGVYGIELERSYRSDRDVAGWFGSGWSSVYETAVTATGDTVTVDAPAGLAPRWRPEAPAGWTVAGSVTVDAASDGSHRLVWPTGERWSFASDGRLVEMRSPYGHTVTIGWAGALPATITSSQGPSLTVTGSADRVVSVAVDDGRTVTYTYDTSTLTAVKAPGLTQNYRYDTDQHLVELSSPSGTTTTTYVSGKVSAQSTLSGQQLDLSYGPDGTTVDTGVARLYAHDDEGRLIRVTEDGNDLEVRGFDAAGNLVQARTVAQPTGRIVNDLVRVFEAGRLVRETRNGTATTFGYDSQGRITTVQTADGATTFAYDGAGPLPVGVDAPGSGRMSFEYGDGFVTSTTDATGVTTAVGRDAAGNPVTTATGDEPAWRYGFDAEGNVVTTTAPSGRGWRATWAPRSTLISETDPLGRTATYTYDDAGRLVRVTDTADRATSYTYDISRRVTSQTRPDGQTTSYRYTPNGTLAATVLPGDREWVTVTTPQTGGGTVVTVTAPDGTRTESSVDTAARETERRVLEADGTETETRTFDFEYDRPTLTVVTRGDSRLETRTTHDAARNVTSTVENLDGTEVGRTAYRYERGNVVEATTAGATARYRYDPAGRLVEVASGDDTWTATFDAGRLVATTHNERTTTVGYDLDGRATTFVDPSATTTVWTFDDADRPVTRTVGDTSAWFTWSDSDQLAAYRAPDGRTWTWTHDPADRIVAAVEPSGATTTYTYTDGAVTRIETDTSDFDTIEGVFDYDPRGLLTKAGDLSYRYDATGLPIAVSDGERSEDWAYDARGNVNAVYAGGDRFDLAYTTAGQLATVSGADTTLTAVWGAEGLASVRADDGEPIRIRTDDARLVGVDWDDDTSIELDWSADATRVTITAPDRDSRTLDIRDGRLTAFRTGELRVSADHRVDGTLDTLQVLDGGQDSSVTFDPLGRPETLTDGTRTATLGYDSAGRIASTQISSPDRDTTQATVTYDGDGGRSIIGDGSIIEDLFDPDGTLTAALPGSLVNPTPTPLPGGTVGPTGPESAADLLVSPEPRPLDDLARTLRDATPQPTTPIGVHDLPALADQMALAAITRLAPSFTVHGDTVLRLPIIDPAGEPVEINPFLDLAAVAQPFAAINRDDPSWRERFVTPFVDAVRGAVGFVSDVVSDIARTVTASPIGRLIVVAGTWIAATVLCPASAACLPVAAAASLLALADGAYTLAASGAGAIRACSDLDVADCGLRLAGTALGIVQVAAGAALGVQLLATRAALNALATVTETGVGLAQASGRVGVAKSDVLATLRMERVIAREVPVCAGQVCARIDSVTQDVFGRLRYVESKNGAGARFTPNQQVVYPAVHTSGGYLPTGLAGRPPQMITSRIDVQHWGSPPTPLALP